jgi:hypothetical protein
MRQENRAAASMPRSPRLIQLVLGTPSGIAQCYSDPNRLAPLEIEEHSCADELTERDAGVRFDHALHGEKNRRVRI